MEKLKKVFGACLVPLLSILLAFLIGGIIMAALGADPFVAVKFLFQGAFGTKAGIGTTLTKATPLMFTALCACFAYKCGVFNLGGEVSSDGLDGGVFNLLLYGAHGLCRDRSGAYRRCNCGRYLGHDPGRLKDHARAERDDHLHHAQLRRDALLMGVIYTSWIRDASVPQTPAIDEAVHLPRIVSGMRFYVGPCDRNRGRSHSLLCSFLDKRGFPAARGWL